MVDEQSSAPAISKASTPHKSLLVMCVLCLAAGFLAGYFLRGSAPSPAAAAFTRTSAPSAPVTTSASAPSQPAQPMPHKMPTMDDMKRMADKKAAPLLAKFKSDPKNPQLANQIGLLYESAHQFKQAAGYFEESLQNDPKNIGVRADYASCLYYSGDVDGAIAQLNRSLTYDPKHAGTLMNLGIIRWKGKNDVDGAVAAWQKLLQYHPDFPQKEMLQHMITEAKQAKAAKKAGEGQKG